MVGTTAIRPSLKRPQTVYLVCLMLVCALGSIAVGFARCLTEGLRKSFPCWLPLCFSRRLPSRTCAGCEYQLFPLFPE
jgi:hypothetical protein